MEAKHYKFVNQVASWSAYGSQKIYKYKQIRKDKSNRIVYSNWDGKCCKVKPAIIYIQGSGLDSVIDRYDNRSSHVYLLGVSELLSYAENDYWFFTFEKRGIDSFFEEKSGNIPDEAKLFYNWEYCVDEAVEVVNCVAGLSIVNTEKIALLGFSEGARIALGAAVNTKYITHLGYMSGAGISPAFELVLLARKSAKSNSDCENKVADVLSNIREILKDPNSIEKIYEELPYKRWASFFRCEPDMLFLKTHIPIFLAKGTMDECSPIEAFDLLQTRMLINGKNNMTFQRYDGYDHQFLLREKKCDLKVNTRKKVYGDFLNWLKSH